jgi:mannose-6-phosphate isomerase-like protein (cupin superfamily)
MEKERIIELPEITDERGTLSFAETGRHIPFQISWISCIAAEQKPEPVEALFIALSGSFRVTVDGKENILDKPHKALYIPDSLHRIVTGFSAGAVCLILSSKEAARDKEKNSMQKEYLIRDCNLIKLADDRIDANLAVNTPFDIKRIFYIYNIPPAEKRGMHAHKFCHEVLIAAKGSFDVELDDGINEKKLTLDNPGYALHIPPGIWAVEKGYTLDAICLVLASDRYDAENYINSHPEFIKYRRNEN